MIYPKTPGLYYPTSFSSFAIDVKNAISSGLVKETVDQVKKAEILILDDIGAEQMSAWVRDEIYRWFCSTECRKISQPSLLLTLILKSWNVILQFRVMEMKPGRPNGSWSAGNFSQGNPSGRSQSPMNETIRLMKSHFSVRCLRKANKEADLKEILSAGQMASSWKNFQSYSVIVGQKQGKERSFFTTCFLKKRFANQTVFSPLCWGFKPRWKKLVKLHEQDFHPEGGWTTLLITSVDAALAAQNTLLAAESLGYGGVIIGMLRYCSEEVAELFRLPDYTYPVLGLLGVPNQQHAVKPRLPLGAGCFWRRIPEQAPSVVTAYDKVPGRLCWSACNRQLERAPCSSIWSTWTRRDQKLLENTNYYEMKRGVLEPRSCLSLEKRKSWPYQLLRL